MGPALIAGVNPCLKGWIAVYMPAIGGLPSTVFHRCFQDICKMPFRVIAVNITIGLPEISVSGGRLADQNARALLKRSKNRLYSAPCRAAVSANSYEEAYQRGVKSSPNGNGVGISKGLYPHLKHIQEVDECITPKTQQRIYESHAELSFRFISDGPLQHAPGKSWGSSERSNLLQKEKFPRSFVECAHFDLSAVAEKDFLDACAACWTARRIFQGKVYVLPEGPPILDARGLRMEKNA